MIVPQPNTNLIINGDSLKVLKELPDQSVNMCMTSPPYWNLRDYMVDGQLGLEPTLDQYVSNLCDIFDEVKRVLKDDGTCWVNLGDTYSTQSGAMRDGKFGKKNTNNQQFIQPKTQFKSKSLLMIPQRFAIEMINRGWILRNTIIWHKPNAMPSSIKDRFTVDFEYIYFFSKQQKYYFETQYEPHKTKGSYKPFNKRVRDVSAGRIASDQYTASDKEVSKYKDYTLRNVRGGNTDPDHRNPLGRRKRTVWEIPIRPFPKAHFATYPEQLCEIPIKAGCPEGGIVLDPFFGAGTTGIVALKQNKNYLGIELNPEYIEIANKRLEETTLNLNKTHNSHHEATSNQKDCKSTILPDGSPHGAYYHGGTK